MRKFLQSCVCLFTFTTILRGEEFHVSVDGKDTNSGLRAAPFRTIQHAAALAQPGDVITVHGGVYRERVEPPHGGASDARRIVYQASPGEKVVIKGSELISNWVKAQGDVWKASIPNSFFGKFNPYSDLIHGDWFDSKGRPHHTGCVYFNGTWLTEAATLQELFEPKVTNSLWFGQMGQTNTILWAQFKGVNPNQETVEINVRRTVFYPERTGVNFITVRGFVMEQAATPWAPPTAEQIGLVGPHWSKGWIIESNVIRYSMCAGISLGKYGDEWDNTAESAEGYVKTIQRALTNGWSGETIGHHVVRGNTISYCEQAGIVGSLGAAFSTIAGNSIHDIHVRRLFGGAEMAGIKLHGAVDVQISHNHIYQSSLGLWLDWMAQGTRVSGNLFHDNGQDVFIEVNHGPLLMDNNLFLSPASLGSRSQGSAFVHNLFAGSIDVPAFDGRQTPFLKGHSTELAGFHDNPRGDDRYYNNVFVQHADLSQYNDSALPVRMEGNFYLGGAKPSKLEKRPVVEPNGAPIRLTNRPDGVYLQIEYNEAWLSERPRKLVNGQLLGKTVISNLAYEQPDGSPIRVLTDYFGEPRNEANPAPGPFENTGGGLLTIKVWN